MRLNINLATQPYQDVRRILVRWTIAVVAVALVTAALVYAAVSTTLSWRAANRQENEVRSQIAERDRIRANAEAFLSRPENRVTRDQSRFINAMIARKAFSWTLVLSDLERIVPSGVQVVNIRPQVNNDNQLELVLTVAGSSRERAVDLVRRLEESSHFRNAEMRSETSKQANTAIGGMRSSEPENSLFEISATYVPTYPQENAVLGQQRASAQPKGGQ